MKKRILTVACFSAVAVAAGAVLIMGTRNKSTDREEVHNVFDEMLEEDYAVMAGAEHIMAGGHEAVRLTRPLSEELYIGLIYSREYKKLYIYGDADMPEGIEDKSYQEYFEERLKEEGISWGEVEDAREDFICGEILDPWFGRHNSSYSRDRLGDLEVIDYLMPYEYCGMENEDRILKTEVFEEGYQGLFEGRVKYSIWDAPGEIQCILQSRDYGYKDVIDRVNADINGFDTTGGKFSLKWNSDHLEEASMMWEYIDALDHGFDFTHWLKYSGKVRGNLTKLAYTREEGEEQTLKMLKRCPERVLFRMVEECEFYMDEENLYMHFPYYDYGAENPGWLENGKGQVWMGWLIVRQEDIQDFLH